MEYFHPKRLPTLRPVNNESTAAGDMEPKQMEYSSLFLLIRIFDEPSIILDIPEELLNKNMRENAIWERLKNTDLSGIYNF